MSCDRSIGLRIRGSGSPGLKNKKGDNAEVRIIAGLLEKELFGLTFVPKGAPAA